MFLLRYIALAIGVLCFFPLFAQIEFIPPTYNHVIAQAEQPVLRKNIRLETLPFVDDFALDGPFPDQDLWVDNYVFVNPDLAISPPSVGVATFDGLDNTGSPYRSGGAGDTLTSVEINLDVVPEDLHLSYFIQPKGFGDQPESNDSLILEFKNEMNEWIVQTVYTGPPAAIGNDDVSFMFDFVGISSAQFLHENFQFRFRNTTSGGGALDLWHLDVVRLLNNQAPSSTYRDLAFQNPSQGILGRFSAMPIRHFRTNTADHLRESFDVNIFNHFDVQEGAGGPSSVMEIRELNSGQTVLNPTQYLFGEDLNINANAGIQVDVVTGFSVSSAIANSQDELVFETMFTIDPTMTGNEPGLLNNNFIGTQTVIDDFFAYDDGVSELSILAQGSGTEIAVEYQTFVLDTLSAIAIQFPHINGDVTDQFFNLKVWLNDLDSDPVFEELLNPIYVDDLVDTLQGFTTYRLQETDTGILSPIIIQPNTTFFIGWEQVTDEFDDAIPVGFDLTTQDVSQFNFFRVNGGDWFDFQSQGFEGAVAIRPIMGVENAIFTSVGDTQVQNNISVYPNPNNTGQLNVKLRQQENQIKQIMVLDLAGRLMLSQDWQFSPIDMSNLPTGIYFINFVDNTNNIIYTEKLILQEK